MIRIALSLSLLWPSTAYPREAEVPLPAEAGPVAAAPDLDGLILDAARRFGNPPVVRRELHRRVGALPADSDMLDDVRLSPRENAERERLVKELFREAGAAEIVEQDVGRGQHNFMVVKPGATDRVLVVGAHHDKVRQGAGVIDNWTGASMVVQLYRLLKDAPTKHTILFMTFGREEEGLLGSYKFVMSLPFERLKKIDAMVNLDTLAVDGTYSWKNNSDRRLLDAAHEAAAAGGYELAEKEMWGGDSDSSSFRDVRIPAMTLFGLSPERVFSILHSESDSFVFFSLAHYKNALGLTGALLRLLDGRESFARLDTVWLN